MENILIDIVNKIQIAEPQQTKNLIIFPLVLPVITGPDYTTLSEALVQDELTITEVNDTGVVPELTAKNKGCSAVLGLNGEELHGAKQNRVLNTTMLIAAHSELRIPVTCTEQHRWSYTSDKFNVAKTFMSPNIRRNKMRHVDDSLRASRGYTSNQRELWRDISQQRASHNVYSSTGAMDDTYKARHDILSEYLDKLKLIPRQCGMLAYINGKPIGCDLLSRPNAYTQLHLKLAKSYALDALAIHQNAKYDTLTPTMAWETLNQMVSCKYRTRRSVGLGLDLRLNSDTWIGSALVLNKTLIHLALFATDSNKISELTTRFRRHRPRRRSSRPTSHPSHHNHNENPKDKDNDLH